MPRVTNLLDYPPRERSLNNDDSGDDGQEEMYIDLDCLKTRLDHFFMDPVQKWKKRRTRPYKLLVQILKIVLITSQLVLYGQEMAKNINYQDDIQLTLKELFLRDWDPSADAIPYPGSYVPYAVYTKNGFYQTINYAIKTYSNLTELSVGSYSYQTNHSLTVPPIEVCITNYLTPKLLKIYTKKYCYQIQDYADAGSQLWDLFDFRNSLSEPINFSKMISVSLKLPISTRSEHVEIDLPISTKLANVDVEILLDNRNMDGQIIVELRTDLRESIFSLDNRTVLLNVTVFLFCFLSFCLCIRSIWRAYKLMRHTESVLNLNDYKLNPSDKLEFIDGWLVLIIVNDLMIMGATILLSAPSSYKFCSHLMGLGAFLSWIGLLRYLSFFEKYNIFIITVKKCFPHVLRFMLGTTIIYCGFCFWGWIVFGPYHFKFRQLSTTSECLFSLINGDDMFETFALLRTDDASIWWFSRVYLYLFVSLFIYFVLSLVIAIIMDAYDLIKQYGSNGFPKSRLQTFYIDGNLEQFERSSRVVN